MNRRSRVVALALALSAATWASHALAQDDDWSVTRDRRHRPNVRRPTTGHGTTRPTTGVRRPTTVSTSRTPTPTPTPATGDAARDRRNRMIALLTQSVLRNSGEEGGPLPILMRLVRERDGSVQALLDDFEARARGGSQDAAPHLVLGHVYRETGRFDDALREYAAAERIAPTLAAAPRAIGALYRRMQRTADARAALERALALTHDRLPLADGLRQLMDLALEARDVPAARRFHERLVATDRASTTLRRELADALLTRRMFSDAVREFESLARAMRGDNRVLPPVLRDLGRAFEGNAQHDEALRSYRRALALAATDAGIRRDIYEAMTEVYTARNALAEWIAELERAQGSDSFERAMLIGRLQEQAGNAVAAIAAYRRATAMRSSDVDAWLHLAQLFHQQGQRNDEIAAYRRLVAASPSEPRFVTELVDLLVGQGARDEAVRLLQQASARAGSNVNMHERLAEAFARHGRAQDATREIEIVARLDPTSPSGLEALGRQYMESGQRDRALATWRRILDTARDRARGAAQLAEVYADNAMLTEAIEMFREAVRLRPTELAFHRGLAGVLERSRQFEQAVAEWRRVIELAPGDRDARRHARDAIVRLWAVGGRLDAQIPILQSAFAATPPDLDAGRDLAEALVRARRLPDAEQALRRLATLDPSDSSVLVTLERVLSQRDDLAGAIDVLRRLVEADPRRARDYWQRMAQHALALHRDEQAVEFASRALQLNDQDATAHLRLAALYRARNAMGPAIASLRRALEINDRLFSSYFELADLYLGFRNEPREAVALYHRVIQLAPDDDYVQRAGRLAIQLAPAAGLGDEVERDLSSAAAAAPSRAVFRRLLVAYYDATARPLIQRVRQAPTDVADTARAELRRLGARALAPLLGALADPDPSQQRVALDILGHLGNPNAASALVAVAEGNADADIRRRAMLAAGPLSDARMLPRLVAILSGQLATDPALAMLATWAIAHVEAPAATRALVASLGADRPADVRAMAALGLARTRDPGARAALRAAAMPGATSSLSTLVRASSSLALGASLDTASAAVLRATLSDGRAPPLLRAASAVALGRSNNAAFADDLARALFAGEPVVRRAAARGIVRLAGGDDETVRGFETATSSSSAQSLLDAMIDPSATPVRGAPALVRFRDAIASAVREALVTDERAQVLFAAFERAPGLDPLVSAEHAGADASIAAAVGAIVEGAIDRVVPLLLHPSQAIRRSAVRFVAVTRSSRTVALLGRAVADDDESVALAALRALSTRDDAEPAFEPIRARLAPESSWSLRLGAVQALARIRTAAATAELVRLLRDDPYEYVRGAAARALGPRSNEPSVQAALEVAHTADPADSVREAARPSAH